MMSVEDRFFKYVSPEPNSGCWLWLSALYAKGYGVLHVSRKVKRATHVSLELHGRPRPSERHMALHHCDVPSCVNPDHLYWGTARNNTDDMLARGRAKFGKPKDFCMRGHPMVGDNLYIHKSGRHCRACAAERHRLKKLAA